MYRVITQDTVREKRQSVIAENSKKKNWRQQDILNPVS